MFNFLRIDFETPIKHVNGSISETSQTCARFAVRTGAKSQIHTFPKNLVE
jgi:hypothetical protein